MVSWLISLSPRLSSSCTILDTVCSMRSGSTLRLRSAISTERASLSRSNGSRRPLRLMTVSSRNCTRSKVVKRNWQERHTRRRRMAAESSVGRESFTWVSRLWHFGQRITPRPFCSALVNREPLYQRLHLVAHRSFGERILLDMLLRQHVEHLDDHVADLAEFRDAEAAGGTGRRAEPHARGHHRLLGIERDAILVAGDMCAPERDLGHLPGQALGPKIHQQQVIVGPARDDIETLGLQTFRQRLGVGDDVAGINLEVGPQRLAECGSLGGDHLAPR